MLFSPMIPVWLMGIVCAGLLFCRRKGRWAYIRQIIMVILLFLTNLRPMLPGQSVELGGEKLDTYVLFVIDDTLSMTAQDGGTPGTRLAAAQQDCAAIIDALSGARFGVISFHNTANRLTPYTDNVRHVKDVINAIYPISSLYANGTDMNVAKDAMRLALKEAAAKTDSKICVFFISDGEITDPSAQEGGFSELSQFAGSGAVLGYGTKDGGLMAHKNLYSGEEEQVMDYSEYPAKPAVSKLDEARLQEIAGQLGLPYVHMPDEARLQQITDQIRREAKTVRKEGFVTESTDPYLGAKDLYAFTVLPLLGLLLFEAYVMIKKRALGG